MEKTFLIPDDILKLLLENTESAEEHLFLLRSLQRFLRVSVKRQQAGQVQMGSSLAKVICFRPPQPSTVGGKVTAVNCSQTQEGEWRHGNKDKTQR